MIAVYTEDVLLSARAEALASELGLPFLDAPDGASALLALTPERLELVFTGPDAPGAVAVDFAEGRMRHRRRGGHNEPLGRAVGVGKWEDLSVADANAGLGRDGYVLADLGCRVTMMERSPAVFALLRDGLRRGLDGSDRQVAEACGRIRLEFGEAENLLDGQRFDVVYLDPMFPSRRKSARVKKEMWLFQQLLAGEPASPELLEAALAAAERRVVVKRPASAPALTERQPAFAIPGKTVRFDVYLP